MTTGSPDTAARARLSLGSSEAAIHDTVAAWLVERDACGVLADVGCGTGALSQRLGRRFARVVGVDVVRYPGLPPNVEFREADLDRGPVPLADGQADAVAAVETIEHLENPRALVRELARVVRPGGWVVVTTPNQLSVLSLLTLVTKQRFSAFQDHSYPAHRTALLEVDLRRIFAECGLEQVEVGYTCSGRIPLTAWHYPRAISRLWPRGLSDNLVVTGRKSDSSCSLPS
jgi:2-polyprenyl-3-methyl-5-hydroxy-6-metoxy-1,4-benzoquinol methylase